MITEQLTAPRVFVSYSHDSAEHKELVREFCTFLQRDVGVDVRLDQWDDDGARDWSAWAIEQLTMADFVLAIASPNYKVRAEGLAAPDKGRGSQFESAIMRDRMTRDLPAETRRILAVVLPGGSVDDIPIFLRPYATTHFVIDEISHEGVLGLRAAFANVARHPKPKRGEFTGNPYAELHARLQVEEQERERATTAGTGRRGLLTTAVKCVRRTADVTFGTAELDGRHYGDSIRFRSSLFSAQKIGVAEFSLGRAYRELIVVAGVLDDAAEADQVGYFTVFLDDVAQPQQKATHGNPVELRVDVTGVLRLRMEAYRPDTVVGPLLGGVFAAGGRSPRLPALAWGNPTLVA
jgi:SEFIR domain-containing protein